MLSPVDSVVMMGIPCTEMMEGSINNLALDDKLSS